jgi:hypothetical protein
MKKNLFNAGVLVLTMVVLLLSVSGCKSKQKVAQEQAAAAYAQKVEQAKQDLLAIINDQGSMSLEEKETRLKVIKEQNFQDAEVQALIIRAEDVLAKIRQDLQAKKKRDAENAINQEQQQFRNEVLTHFRSVAGAATFAEANQRIAKALRMFASEDIPLLIIISQENGMKDYDRPTTIRKYLEYLKDQGRFDKYIENLVVDKNGKITEIELIKK